MVRTLMFSSVFLMFGVTQAWGQTWNMCDPLIRQYEAAHNIPHKLLTAISLVESGRKVGGAVVAWPWTINANGKPYVFATKNEAVAMIRKLYRGGITNIDVGCMQVNLKQHPRAFPTLEAALDPATNIAYAAQFLKKKKENRGSWMGAVAHYHSSTTRVHLPYREKVLKAWAKAQNDLPLWMVGQSLLGMFEKPSVLEMTYTDIKKHEGEFVENVAAPSGRRLPVVVKFSPYKGFNGKIPGVLGIKARKGRAGGASPEMADPERLPKNDGPKIIVNTLMMPHQRTF